MKQKLFLSLAALLFSLPVALWLGLRHPQQTQAQVSPSSAPAPVPPTTGGACASIGNNIAYPAGQGGGQVDYAEAQYTLASLNGDEDKGAIINAINSGQNIIIRIGGAKENWGPDAANYVRILREISAAVGGKQFIATASHNEANCAETRGAGTQASELAFANAVVSGAGGISNLTLITGQIDHYCGVAPDGTPIEWAQKLGNIGGIDGIALPYYITDGTPTAQATFEYFKAFVAQLGGKRIYITESGPLKENSMPEFTQAVSLLYQSGLNFETMLLFNAFGVNQDGGFRYTSPFWNPLCREAFRTSCTDPEYVLQVCGSDAPQGYYLYPLSGLEKVSDYNITGQPVPQNEVAGISGEILNDLINQGYQAYCTTPTFNIKGGYEGDVQRFRELYAPGSGVFDITSSLKVATNNAEYPLFRSSSGSNSLMNSLETYWGFQNIDRDLAQDERALQSGAVYKLLSLQQQCEQKVAIAKSIQTMCGKLENPQTCALYIPIPGYGSFSTRTILSDFQNAGLNCKDVGDFNLTQEQQEVANALMNVPLFLDKAYRLAFLVVNIPLQEYQPSVFFNFLRIPDPEANFAQGTSKPANEVRVLAFRIPDFGTNRNPDDPGSYLDPLQLARNAISSPQDIQERLDDQVAAKEAVRSAGDKGRIQCSVLPNELDAQVACQDPLSKAVIDLVNKQPDITGPRIDGTWGSCDQASAENLPSEDAKAITDSADLNNGLTTTSSTKLQQALDATLTFRPDYQILKSLFSVVTGQSATPQQAEFNFISKLDIHKDGGADSKAQMYLVYPVGYELKDAETALASLIFNPTQREEYFNDPKLEQYFAMSGLEATWESEKETISFFDPEKCRAELISAASAVPPRLPNLELCNNEAGATVVDTQSFDRQPRVLGGVLGNLMRSIQLSLHTIGSGAYNYVASCETTEEFLTGNCSGKGPDTASSDGVDTSGITPLAQCNITQTGRITSGETAIHIASTTDPSCNVFDAATHTIPEWLNPNDVSKPCDFLYSYASCTYPKSLIANFVDSSGKFAESGSETACEYIVRRAQAANVSPRFTLAMWGEESGFSGTDAWDLGVVSQPKKDLGAQMDAFINLVNIYRSDTTSGFERFMLRYSGEGAYGQWLVGTPFCTNIYFPGRLKTYYDYLAP